MLADRRRRVRRACLVLIRCRPAPRQAPLARRIVRRVARLFARPLRPVPLGRPVARSARAGTLRLAGRLDTRLVRRAPARSGFVLFALLLAAGLLLSAAFLSWTALHGTRSRGGTGDPLVGWSRGSHTTCLPWETSHA
jgi:hypothetical protein